jgi:hypothetical protein
MLKPHELFELPSDIARKKKRAEPKSTRKEMEAFLAKYNSMTNKKTLKRASGGGAWEWGRWVGLGHP